MIYLDNAATIAPKKEVIDAMMPYFTDKWYNPSALYGEANRIKIDIENARNTVGDFINAKSNEIFFTSGGSESNCWAIQGFINYWRRNGCEPTIITSTIEHKSVLSCVDYMNADVHYVEVDNEGFINIEALEKILDYVSKQHNKILVSVQYANNEIGTIQHIKHITEIVHKYNAFIHTDAVQALGHIYIDVKYLDVDMLSASGHKLGAPKGIGFLYKKDGVNIDSLIYGSQMDGMRGGTENVPYIIGMAKAIELCKYAMRHKTFNVLHAREYMISQLKTKLNCKVNGASVCRLENNINVTFPQNISGESLIYMLDLCGIYISSGSACNSRSIEPSHVLKAIGLTNEETMKTIRISLPENIDKEMVDKVICEIERQVKLLSYD